jgi:hypothetical protein
LQKHLQEVRLAINPNDAGAWWRGVDILSVLIGVVALLRLWCSISCGSIQQVEQARSSVYYEHSDRACVSWLHNSAIQSSALYPNRLIDAAKEQATRAAVQ